MNGVTRKKNVLVGLLVFIGAQLYAMEQQGVVEKRLLGCAAREGDVAAMQWLCEHGASKEHALMLAVGQGDLPLVQWLVEKGADIRKGHSIWLAHAPLHLAQQYADSVEGCADIVRYLEHLYGMELRSGTRLLANR